jgi:hypothetical protein
MGDTTVVIRGNQTCTHTSGDTVKRCFEVTPSSNNPAIGKTVTFFFDQSEEAGNVCGYMNAYRFAISSWTLLALDPSYDLDGRMCGPDPRSVRVINLTSFAPFVLHQNEPPAVMYFQYLAIIIN